MAITKKWSAFPSVTATTSGDALVGLQSAVNKRFLVSTTPSASGIALWDANSNMSASNTLNGYATTVTAAGTTTLTVASKYHQYFTGVSTQTVTLPVAATLVLGQTFSFVNLSSGAVDINSSGGNLVQRIGEGICAIVTCILTSGTGVASWSVKINAIGTNLTGTGAMVFSTSPTLITPVLGAASATSISFSSANGIIGVTDGGNATAGSVGEVISSAIVFSSAIAISNNTSTDLTSIILSAGDWDVRGNVVFNPTGITTLSQGWMSQTSATLPDASLRTLLPFANTGVTLGVNVPSQRFSLAGAATIYLSGRIAFSTGTCTLCGNITARRMR